MSRTSFVAGLICTLLVFNHTAQAESASISDGLNWLSGQQAAEGNWTGTDTADYVATSAASDAQHLLDAANPGYAKSFQWLAAQTATSTDYLARRIIAQVRAGQDASADVSKLLSLRDGTGGWGGESGYQYNILDTALALQALKAAGFDDPALIGASLNWLAGQQRGDGSFGFYPGAPNNTYLTALVVNTFCLYQDRFPVQYARDKGVNYLLAKQNPDGGFGSSSSTAYDSALAFIALVESGQTGAQQAAPLQSAVNYLTTAQAANGSWNDDPYSTALALQALARVRPNLAASSLAISKSMPLDGETVTLTARVDNLGLESAANVVVRFFAGDPTAGGAPIGADQVIPLIAAGSSAEVSITHSFAGTGSRTLFVVVDPDNAIAETVEADNRASAKLWVAAAADLAISSGDLKPSTFVPAPGTAFALEYTIRNLGEAAAEAFTVDLYDGNPAGGGILLQSTTVSGLPGGGYRAGTFGVTLAGSGSHTLYVAADTANAVAELLETNNAASVTLQVGGVQQYADLAAGILQITPSRPAAGETVEIAASVRNQGMENAAPFTVEIFDGAPEAGGVLLSSQTLSLASGEERLITAGWTVPPGIHDLYLIADRPNQIIETDETNNQSTIRLMTDMVDISVSATDLVHAPSQPVAGDSVVVSLTLRNLGIRGTGPFTAVLYDGDPEAEGMPLQTYPVANLAADGSATLTYAFTAEPKTYRFYALADTENAVGELYETNNQAIRSLTVKAPGETFGPDLAPVKIDLAQTATDSQTLAISGTAAVTFQNKGDAKVTSPFDVLVFEDTDLDARYTAGVDNLLGTAAYSNPIWPEGAGLVNVSLTGTVRFLHAPLYALIDSADTVLEQDEVNNLIRSGSDCESRPANPIEPVVKWARSDLIHARNPVIANLTDDNGDGRIDGNDIPDIVFTQVRYYSWTVRDTLWAIDGKTGEDIFSVWPDSHMLTSVGRIAVGDIDDDGLPEIVLPGKKGGIVVYEHDGTLKWDNWTAVSAWNMTHVPYYVTSHDTSAPVIADIDADGHPEIIVGATVVNPDGSIRWVGRNNWAWPRAGAGASGLGYFDSVVVDLDLDGKQEIVAGNTAYNSDGTVRWLNSSLEDGFVTVGNFDENPYPELVQTSWLLDKVYLLDHDGKIKWGPVDLKSLENSGVTYGSAPVVADFDGDGEREIGIRGYAYYHILDKDGNKKRSIKISAGEPGTQFFTGATVFDLNGDGRPEIIINDAGQFKIFDGLDGSRLYGTGPGLGIYVYYFSAFVADMDRDGHAEIVILGNVNLSGKMTLKVYGAKNNDWVGARSVWNQWNYHVTNVNDDGTIPQYEAPSWLLNNTYRCQARVGESPNPYLASNLTASYLRAVQNDASVDFTVRIGNGGAKGVPVGATVTFFEGVPSTGTVIGTAATTRALAPGEYQDVTLNVSGLSEGLHQFYAVIDRGDTTPECSEADNQANISVAIASSRPDLRVTSEEISLPAGAITEGSIVPMTVVVRNVGSLAASNVSVHLYHGNPAAGGTQLGAAQTIPVIAAGGSASLTVSVDTLNKAGANILYVVVDQENAIAEADEANNTALVTLDVLLPQLPNLSITADGIQITPASALEGAQVAITATVVNRGAAAGNIPVRFYLGDPATGGTLIAEQTIYPVLSLGQRAMVQATLDTLGRAGEQSIHVKIDPANAITESSEDDNAAARTFFIQPAGLASALAVDKAVYQANENILITLTLAEKAGAARSLGYELLVEDLAGNPVSAVAAGAGAGLALGPHATAMLSAQWNAGATLAGDYRLLARITEEGRVVGRATVPFVIRPQKAVFAAVAADKVSYGANEAVALTAAVTSQSANHLFSGLTATLTITDPQGGQVYSSSKPIALLTPGQSTPVTAYWNTAGGHKGAYTARLEVFEGETLLSQAQSLFEVLGSADTGAGLGGSITVEPAVIEYGESGQLFFTVRNQGNEALTGHLLALLLVDPDTKEAVRTIALGAQETLPAAGTQTGTAVLETDGLALKNYLVVLQVESATLHKSLAGAAFRVKDETPPSLGVLSPLAGETYRTGVPITVQAADAASGIDRVEYRLDAQEIWTALPLVDPASGAYAALRETILADDGDHTLVVRVIDRAGNQTVAVPVAFMVQMDSTPPVSQLTIGEPRFPVSGEKFYVTRATPFTLSATDDLSGVQGTWYRFDEEAAWRLYEGSFRLDDLAFGPHAIAFRSANQAGNQEEEQAVTVTLFDVEVATEILNPPRVLVWTGDPDRTGGKDRPPYTLTDVRALVAEALSEPDAYVTLVTDKDAFQQAFRSGLYNVVVILEQDTPLDANFLRELREAVRGGTGLLISSWKNSVHPILQELFGVNFRGSLAMSKEERPLRLLASPLASEQTLPVQGRVLRTLLAGGALAGVIPGDSTCSGVHSLTLNYPVEVRPGDRLTATLSAPQGKKLVTVDEEHATVTTLPAGVVNGSLGNTGGDLAIAEVTAEGLTFLLSAPYGDLAASYVLAIAIEHADGNRLVAGPTTITPTCDAHFVAGMMIGPLQVSRVEERRSVVTADLPAVVLGSYGAGRTVFLAYDLVGSALAGEQDGHAALLRNSATWLLPEDSGARAGGIALLQTRLLPRGAEVDLKAVDTLGEGLIHLPLFGLTRQPLEYTFHLGDQKEGSYRYFLRIPETESEYEKTTDVSLGLDGGYVPFGSYPFRFTVETGSQAKAE